VIIGINSLTAIYWPTYVARAKGLYAKNGIEADIILTGSPVKGVQQLISGSLDIAHPTLYTAVNALAQGAKFTLVGCVVNTLPYSMVARPEIKSPADLVGKSVYEGRGAGAGPTASAVMSDVLDIARGVRLPAFGTPAAQIRRPDIVPISDHSGACYLRFTVIDRPGVIAVLSRCLADQAISIESMLQRSRSPGEPVPVVMITHEARESAMTKALSAIVATGTVMDQPCMVRIERF
jgi:hypothetical protein